MARSFRFCAPVLSALLFAAVADAQGTAYCDPGQGGVIACPCGNPPAGLGRGCDNSASTGGASIAASGAALIAADTLVVSTANQTPSTTSMLLQGTYAPPSGMVFGQGVRCVAGMLKRIYYSDALGGSCTFPQPGWPTITWRSAALGDPLYTGAYRYYLVYYRDPVVLGGCAATSTFNSTNAISVLWQ